MQPMHYFKLEILLCFLATAITDNVFTQIKFSYCHDRIGTNTNVTDERDAISMLDCGSMCLEDSQCKSATFRGKAKRCILSSGGDRFHESECDCLPEEKDADFIFVKYPCRFQMPFLNGACQCSQGYSGDFCETPPRDCVDHTPNPCGAGLVALIVYPYGGNDCNGLTVFCNRCERLTLFRAPSGKFSTSSNAGWLKYKTGFGRDKDPEYWIGNEYMHQITANPNYKYKMKLHLRISGDYSQDIYYGLYISNESSGYGIYFSSVEEKRLSAAVLSNGSTFRTFDRNDNGCVSQYGAAFWYPLDCSVPSPLGGTYYINNSIGSLTNIHAWIERI